MQALFFSAGLGDDARWLGLLDCPDYMTFDDLARVVYERYPREIEQSDALIVRPRVDQPFKFSSTTTVSALTEISNRAPNASLHLLYSEDFSHYLSPNLNEHVTKDLPAAPQNGWLHWIRQQELRHYITHSSALFRAREHFIYRAPSGAYLNMFLRVGNVQLTRQAVDAFFFWMLPFLRDRSAILTETWSISSIALNAARFLDRYRSYQPPECRVDMLSRYHDDSLSRAVEISDALARVNQKGTRKALVLISAVSTGNSLSHLRQTIQNSEFGDDHFRYLALYKVRTDANIDALCDLSDGVEGVKFEVYEQADTTARTVIEIDPHVYFPLHVVEGAPLKIRAGSATPSYEFFTRYQGIGALSLHRNAVDLNGQVHRHHAVYVDVDRLLDHQSFHNKLLQILDEVPVAPRVIVTPPHHSGRKLAAIVSSFFQTKFGLTAEIILHPDLRPEAPSTPKGLLSSLCKHDLIILLDDVAVTGARLGRYRTSLRELRCPARIMHLVGVARPSDEATWKLNVRNWQFRSEEKSERHIVQFVEKIVLPDWNENTCPWCIELRALRTIHQSPGIQPDVRRFIGRRMRALQLPQNTNGLIQNALWCLDEGITPELTPGSVFLEHSQSTEADTIAAIAAALQVMRTREADRLELSYPYVVTLDSEDYLGKTTYTDIVLALGIIRAAKTSELRHWDDKLESVRRDRIRDYLLMDIKESDSLKLEICQAMISGKVPRPSLSEDDWAKLSHLAYVEFLRLALSPRGGVLNEPST